jgi:hypothetical protein
MFANIPRAKCPILSDWPINSADTEVYAFMASIGLKPEVHITLILSKNQMRESY